jgi:hypothetical protein
MLAGKQMLWAASAFLFALSNPATGAADAAQDLERTCFQTGQPYSDAIDLRSDVAIVYGIDPGLSKRVDSWRARGYRIHVMTGVSWGNYQDYLYGRFDGVHHEDEAQTDRQGQKISHGGDVYYMCPGARYGHFLCLGVQRALDARAEAIHLEEPEFWVRGGYSEGFKREWKSFYGEDWTAPHTSVDAQWRASKLKYYLYRRALQQVFAYIQDFNRRLGRSVRGYVPTHSLLNYAHWRIVSPESSLARLNGCDGYIAQVWTGTARTPNLYRGQVRERTFETAFLEYGAMQNLVRATGRTVWYLNDPVEDNPNHDWADYRRNWESTLAASLLQPQVWQYEVMPWPERVWRGRYPSAADPKKRERIPPAYALELQTVINTLNSMRQEQVEWDSGPRHVGVLVSDSLMFERGEPSPSDPHLSQFYGLALPLLERGIPVEPVQLENLSLKQSLDGYDLLLASYHGLKPLTPDVHAPMVAWVKAGGVLVFWDDDSDPYNRVREWWNTPPFSFVTPRQHLFQELGLGLDAKPGLYRVGQGLVLYRAGDPAALAHAKDGDRALIRTLRQAVSGTRVRWREMNYLRLSRGPYVIAAGLEESPEAPVKVLRGPFIDLFDSELSVHDTVALTPGSRHFLVDLSKLPLGGPRVVASACKVVAGLADDHQFRCSVEGIAATPGLVLLRLPAQPVSAELEGQPLTVGRFDTTTRLAWVKFPNQPRPRELVVRF